MNCCHRLKASQCLRNIQHYVPDHTATTGTNKFRCFQRTYITKVTDDVKDLFWHATQGHYENVNPKNNQGTFKRQHLIPCDLYSNIRCMDSECGYISLEVACKETYMILIFNKINRYGITDSRLLRNFTVRLWSINT
jgi:hypothetical protein